MRIERVIEVAATDTVGPTRLRLLTAASVRLPVVVVAPSDNGGNYFVFDVATLQAVMASSLSATPLSEALDLAKLQARTPVSKADAKAAEAGSPVVENGRLIGVVAEEIPERKEYTEADMARGGSESDRDSGSKRGLWKRLSGSGN